MKSDLARRLAALSPAQRDVVQRRLRKRAGVDGPESIPRRESRDNLPQSLDQERLWFVQQLDPQSAAYNIYTAVRFKGVIKHPALERALNEIVRRHEIMRTSFAAPNGRPLQIISPELQARIPLIDLLSIPPADREHEAQRLAGANVSRPFDLARLPLFRAVLIQVSAEEFICPTVFHHIITDWVSFHAFDRELATLYAAFRDGQPSPLAPLPIQYADFAAWQREWLSGEVQEEQIEWWRRQLDGAPPLIDLPADRPRPPMQTPNGLRQPLVLSAEHSDGVRAMAQRLEITPFIALLTVFKLLLFRLTGHARLVVGSPIANRNRPELEDLLGFFINHLVFCTDMRGDPTFDDLLRRVRETAVGAYSHQDVPFGKLVDALRSERDLSRTPLTQVVFLFLNPEQQGEISFSGLRIAPYMIDSESSKFDMTFSLWDGPAGYAGWFEYNPDLFDRTTILRMGEQFRALLGWVVENGGRRISESRMLSAAERQQVVVEWNDTGLEQDARSYVERIEEQARLRPDAPAVSDERGAVTFSELNQRANVLARRLVREGVGLETPVGVVVDRGVELVIAWLAVGKAGGAYLAVGEGVPRVRWEAMVADAKAPLIVSRRHRAEGYAGRVVWMEEESGSAENLGIRTAPENLAYVIFTSGSTGKPKGVAVEHRGLSNLMDWHLRVHGVRRADRASQVANAGFDAAGAEIWPYLSVGASVTFASDEQRHSPAALVEWLAREQVTFCFLPTPLAEAALAEDFSHTRLRVLFTGGDRLRQRPPRTLRCPLWNLYGPTESTVVGTGGRVSAVGRTPASADGPLAVHSNLTETSTSRARAPGAGQGTRPTDSEGAPDIGGPIANTRAYVLDERGGLAAIGVIGELYLGGAGLARGYLGQAAETAERFVPDAVSGESGQRLYRTGDLVKWGRDGRLVYVGRGDEQVKLRGYRIELGEVETQLAQLEGVAAAAVVLKGEGERRRLAAYVVGGGVDAEELRAKLRERLPDYMVPSVISVLDELPVTTNGKIDRAALAKLEDTIVGRPGLVLPRTPAEATLARIWREVLGVAEVGVFDNFFQIGGDSILSIQIVGRARAAGLHIAPKQMFQHQTVAELAAAAHALQTVAEIGPISGPTPLTPIQLWFFEQDLADPHRFNQAVLFEVDSPPAPAVLLHAVAELNRHHDALRTRFHRRPAGWQAEIAEVSNPPFTFVDLSQAPEGFELAAESLQRSLNLEHGPMFHVAHFHYGADRPARLLLVAHHLVVDGVSWRILLEDFETACRGETLPPKTSSFRQWATRLRQYAEQDELQSEAAWWRSVSPAKISPLPQRTPLGENTEASAATSEFSLDPEETQALLRQAGIAHRTQLQELLVFACAEALADWSGGSGVAINIEGHGREEIFDDLDLSRTVGWFTAIFPFAHDFTEAADFVERLKLVKTRLRSVSPHGFSYGLLRYLRNENLGTEAEVVFNYLGRLDASVPSDSRLRPAAENAGASRSPQNRRKYLLEIDAGIAGGRLRVRWTYSRNRHDPAEIDRLVSTCAQTLRQLIGGRVPGDSLTHADFPLANLNPAQFAALVASCGVMEDVYRLSPLQEAMLFHVLSTPTPGAFCEQVDCVLAGELDTGLFQHAWRQAIQHHTTLRTCFFWDEFDTPVQVVVPEVPLEIAELDWRDDANEWRAFVERDRAKGFDLTRAPLMRIVLARTGEATWRCLWTCHHLLLDGWSLRMVLNDVMSIYGQHATLAAARPYADFIRWLGRQDFARAEEYWRRTLAGFSKPTPLGANPVWDWSGDEVYADLPRDLSPVLSDELRALARDRQLTLNTTIQGAWALLIGAASNSDDVVFGTTVSGRPPELPGVETMIGVFINTLPVRVKIKRDARVDAWLKALQSDQAEAKEFEYSPQVQEWSEVPLAVPLFDSLVVFENYPVNQPQAAVPRQLNIRELNSPVRTKYALTMVVAPGERIRLSLSYDPRRFASATITEIMNDFEGLLTCIASRPEDKVEAAVATVARRVSLITSPENTAAAQATRTPVEQMVAAIWFEVTGSNASGTRSLFEMGGHSLIATRLATRLRSTFSIALPLRHVFEAPTVRGLARRIEAELAAKRQVAAIPIQPAARDRDLPLSYEQMPIWRVHQSLPQSVYFNFFAVLRMEGELDVAALRASFAEIVRRHEALRTGFAEVDGRPLQCVHNAPLRMPFVDLSELPEDSRLDRAASFISHESGSPFNLAGDPLLRPTCLRMRPQEHLLCLSMHHIATDGWSSGVLAGELALLYEAYCGGRQSPLPPLPVQYPDFAVWQRELAASGAYDEPLRDWVARIAASPSTLELPTDAPRPAPSLLVARGDWKIDADLLRRLRALSGREGGSLFMTLLAAFEMVLAKHSGQSEFWIGTLAANRTRPEVENLIGLFVNTLLLRCSVPPGIEFSEMLKRTREVVLDAFERQDLPYELGVQKLERESGIEQARLCPVLFIMQNPSLGPVSLPGLRLTPIETKTDGGRPEIYPTSFELIVNVAEEEERLVVSITYKTDLFTRERITGMARDWAEILEAMG